MIRKENKDEKRSSTGKKTSAVKERVETKSKSDAGRERILIGRFQSQGAAVAPEKRRPKNVVLSHEKLARAKDLLGTRTESEAIEMALERVIDEESRNRDAWNAHDAFAREMIENKFEIEDVFGRLER